jgi:DNA-binding HxlR family transcriptional regulator
MTNRGQYCPVSFAADLLGDRWTLLIMRELIGGATRFNEIERCLPRVSRSLLSQRLRHLTQVGLIECEPVAGSRHNQYRLSPAGRDLQPILMSMGDWAVRWIVGEPRPDELDPTFLLIWLQRTAKLDAVPPGRTIVRFDILGDSREVFWLVLQPDEASVCMVDPGIEVDVYVEADSMAFHRVFAGLDTLDDAVRAGTVAVRGPRALTRQLGSWLGWSPFHGSTRALVTQRSSTADEPPLPSAG